MFSLFNSHWGWGDLDTVYWLPGSEDPADGAAEVKSDMVSLHRFLEPGDFRPGMLGPLKRVSTRERPET